MKADSIENILSFFEKLGIKAKNEQNIIGSFNRIIEFEIEGRLFFIEWWINQSYFKLAKEFSTPKMPFKFINVSEYNPTVSHKYELCFYDEKKAEENDFIYNEIPFGAFRIPFNSQIKVNSLK